jgi:hypothetical protein
VNYCASCGNTVEISSRFCGTCGSSLSLHEPPAKKNLPVPFYLRWYSILLSFVFWPAWFPVGPFTAAGLWLVRMRTVPASRAFLGWFITLLGAPWVIVWLFSQIYEMPQWLRNILGVCLLFSLLFTAFGIRLLWQARKAKKLIRLIHKQKLRTLPEVASALGANDLALVRADILRVKQRGWLEGYEFDPIAGRIYDTAIPASFLQTVGRSKLGVCSLAVALILLLIFLTNSPVRSLKKQEADVAEIYEIVFSNQVTACDVMPKENLSRILDKNFVYADVTHFDSGTRCNYFITDPRKARNAAALFWIELLPKGIPEERGGDWADRLGVVILNNITDTTRAKAIRAALKRDDVRVRDFGLKFVDFRFGNAQFAIQSSMAPEWEAFFILAGKPDSKTWKPTDEQFAEIASEICSRIPAPQ